jgi:hypothetical protein
MSGLAHSRKSNKSGGYRRVRPRLFASVHGVTVVILWSAASERGPIGRFVSDVNNLLDTEPLVFQNRIVRRPLSL